MMRLFILMEVTSEREQTPAAVCRDVGVRGDRGDRRDGAGEPGGSEAVFHPLQGLLLRKPGLFDGRLPRTATLREGRQQRGLLAGRPELRPDLGGVWGKTSDLTKNGPPRPALGAEALFQTPERTT